MGGGGDGSGNSWGLVDKLKEVYALITTYRLPQETAMFDASLTFKTGSEPVNVIMCFRNENFFLSNMYPADIRYEDGVYPATENAYFAWMSYEEDIKVRLQDMTPQQAKAFAQTDEFKAQRIFKFQDDLVKGMEVFVRQKFFSHEDLADKLLATGHATLVEGNTWGDEIFGFNLKTGNGLNELGKMLMRIRTEIAEMRMKKGA